MPTGAERVGEDAREVNFTPGKDYDVVIASIDAEDTAADGAAEKGRFLASLGTPNAGANVHFLTGPQASINDLSAATGFHYVRIVGPDGKMDQFAHSSVIMIATPDGRMSKYLFGIDYQPRDVRLAVIQASTHHIGTLSDLILLYCCNYSPSAGKYTVSILRVMGLAGMGSLVYAVGAAVCALAQTEGRERCAGRLERCWIRHKAHPALESPTQAKHGLNGPRGSFQWSNKTSPSAFNQSRRLPRDPMPAT